jgi:hypothetical protein
MLFNGNDDEMKLSISDSKEEDVSLPKNTKSKVERVFEDIIREQLQIYSGRPEINQRSRKLADKMLKQFYSERRE